MKGRIIIHGENVYLPLLRRKKFALGKQDGYAEVYPADKFFSFKSQKLYHEICLDCGTVVRSYIKNPEKLT